MYIPSIELFLVEVSHFAVEKSKIMLGLTAVLLCSGVCFLVEGAYQNKYEGPLDVSCPDGKGIDRIKVSQHFLT